MSALASLLFNDGVHHVFTFLTTQEWNNALLTSHHWYNLACKTEPTEVLYCNPTVLISFAASSLLSSPLRRHVTSLAHSLDAYSHERKFHHFALSQLYSYLNALPLLTSAEVELANQDDDPSKGSLVVQASYPLLQHMCLHESNIDQRSTINDLAKFLTRIAPQLTYLQLTSFDLLSVDLTPLSQLKELRRLNLSHPQVRLLGYIHPREITETMLQDAFNQLVLLGSADFAQIESVSYVIERRLMHQMLAHQRWSKVVVPQMHHISPLAHLDHGASIVGKLARAFPHLRELNAKLLDCHANELLQMSQLESLSLNYIDSNEFGLGRDLASEHI